MFNIILNISIGKYFSKYLRHDLLRNYFERDLLGKYGYVCSNTSVFVKIRYYFEVRQFIELEACFTNFQLN